MWIAMRALALCAFPTVRSLAHHVRASATHQRSVRPFCGPWGQNSKQNMQRSPSKMRIASLETLFIPIPFEIRSNRISIDFFLDLFGWGKYLLKMADTAFQF
jgi:hypothetical protein